MDSKSHTIDGEGRSPEPQDQHWEDVGYAWEKEYEKSWEKVREDRTGNFADVNIDKMIQEMET